MPFGVELPDNLGSPSTESTTSEATSESSVNPVDGSSNAVSKDAKPETIQEILDLDKQERFRFQGKEWTPKELRSAYMAHQDYTRKTTELAEARKFADNFEADLSVVLKNPAKLEELKKIYPAAYVQMAEKYLAAGSRPGESANRPQQDDPRIQNLEQKIQSWEEAQHKAEVQKIESWLTSEYESLGKKYPYANSEVISARAELLAKQGNEINRNVLDKLFKHNNDELKKVWDGMYKAKAETQKQAGLRGKDMGAGGGVPGQAPKGARTIKDATKQFLEDFGVRNNT